jgi:hypothetical protein
MRYGILQLQNLLTLLGEAKAYDNIYCTMPGPSEKTAVGYRLAFERYLSTGSFGRSDRLRPSTVVWHKAAFRFGALEILRAAIPDLEAAVSANDHPAAEAAGHRVARVVEMLRRNPPGKPGGRPRDRPPGLGHAGGCRAR